MKLRYSLLAGAALLGLTASPALAIEQIHIPDPNQPANGAPPDGLFDHSVPDNWQSQSQSNQNANSVGGSLGNFHFSATSGNNYTSGSTTYGQDTARTPGAEFNQQGVPLQDPYFFPR